MQRRVLITTLPPSILNVVRLVKFRNAPIKTLHFISKNVFFLFLFFVLFFSFLILWKRSNNNNNKTDMERKNYLVSVDSFLMSHLLIIIS